MKVVPMMVVIVIVIATVIVLVIWSSHRVGMSENHESGEFLRKRCSTLVYYDIV